MTPSLGAPPLLTREACPLHPFSISGFEAPGGPAQMKGVFTGWFIDVIHLIKLLGEKQRSKEFRQHVPEHGDRL